jgi:hypothetical protein
MRPPPIAAGSSPFGLRQGTPRRGADLYRVTKALASLAEADVAIGLCSAGCGRPLGPVTAAAGGKRLLAVAFLVESGEGGRQPPTASGCHVAL